MVEPKAGYSRFIIKTIIVVLILGIALLGRYFAPHDPYLTSLSLALQPPTLEYPFGTDHLGRCILSRVLYATPISIFSAVLVVFASTILGTSLGVLSGYLGGIADRVISQIVITFQAFPSCCFCGRRVGIWDKKRYTSTNSRFVDKLCQI